MENWCFDACRTFRPWLNAYVPSQGHAARFPAVNLYLLHRFLNPDCLPQKFRCRQRLDTDTVELSERISPLISAISSGSRPGKTCVWHVPNTPRARSLGPPT